MVSDTKRSTELATTLFFDNIKSKVNEGDMVGAVFIELSHIKLIRKLESYGVNGVELEWITDLTVPKIVFKDRKNRCSTITVSIR